MSRRQVPTAVQDLAGRLAADFPGLPAETITAGLLAATAVVGERDDEATAMAAVEAAARAELALLQADLAAAHSA